MTSPKMKKKSAAVERKEHTMAHEGAKSAPEHEAVKSTEHKAAASAFSVTPSSIDFKDATPVQLKVEAGGKDVTSGVKFGSEDGSVAVVSATGLVTPVGPGTVKISANAPSGQIAHVDVTVPGEKK